METYAQRSIKHCLDMIAPFEMPEQQEDGKLQFYRFMISIYQGMYQEPEKFLVFPGPYEEYIRKPQYQEAQKKKEKEHGGNARESTLRNTFQQSIQFYALFFYQAGLKSRGIDERSGSLVIPKEEYTDVTARMNRIHESRYNAERYQVLSELGIQIYEENDAVHIVHRTYKQAMEGIEYLCKAPESKYKWMNFLRLDYKNAYSPVPTVEDIRKTLPAKSSEAVKRLEDYLEGVKVKAKIKPLRGIVSDFKWKVEYARKGKNICGFYADNEYLMLCVCFNNYQNINGFAKILLAENPGMFQWFKEQFPERLCKCPSNRRVDFGGESRRICGLSNRAEIVNPSEEDVDRVMYILRKYHNIDR